MLSFTLVAKVFAVHDLGVFQMDGNAQTSVQSNPAASDDWDRVCHEATITKDTTNAIPNQCAGASDTTGATAVAFTSEPDGNTSIFTGGGSKDPTDISGWAWKDGAGGIPDKDNLRDAYAARYSVPGTGATGGCPDSIAPCDVLYFGADRFANDGDAQMGFWFLQNEVTLGTNKVGGGFGFSGVHREGDLLVLADFSNGGDTATMKLYQWVTSGGDVAPNLKFLTEGQNRTCSVGLTADDFCGIVSPTGLTTSPWAFQDKDGNTSFQNGEFFEAGVNLSFPAIGLDGECFATVITETRSSTSPTATLKDFVRSKFGRCTSGVTSAQNWLPNDTATASVGGKAVWTGKIRFTLYDSNDCTGTKLYPTAADYEEKSVDNTAPSATTSNATVKVTASKTVSWKTVFISGTSGVPDSDPHCETTSLTITN